MNKRLRIITNGYVIAGLGTGLSILSVVREWPLRFFLGILLLIIGASVLFYRVGYRHGNKQGEKAQAISESQKAALRSEDE